MTDHLTHTPTTSTPTYPISEKLTHERFHNTILAGWLDKIFVNVKNAKGTLTGLTVTMTATEE
jgi:hypothetical protein